jgi:glycosyltransferase involved in cell wall biosynthesis
MTEEAVASAFQRLRYAGLEYLEYDSTFVRWLVAAGGAALSALLWRLPDKSAAFRIMSRVHRSGGSDRAALAIQRAIAQANQHERNGRPTGLWRCYESHIDASLNSSQSIVQNAKGLLGYRVLVLKGANGRERGVIAIDYSYIFPLFAALFDIESIARRYYIVLEPSWRGLCTADILSYSKFDFPVFVQTIEPRDTQFINGLEANFVTVPIAANWWVDHRLVKPNPAIERDIDVIMVAAWSSVKRHWRFFRVLGALRRRGHRLKVVLVGYDAGKTRTAIEAEARHFGVADQVEFHEGLTLVEVAGLLARSKVHVLWSRKEGANRAIVEALFADVPIVLRDGLSYGHHYPYVNPATGRFADEKSLGEVLVDMVQNHRSFRPREWALANMSCQQATAILEDSIRSVAIAAGEPWTKGLAVKTVHLESQQYWDPGSMVRFSSDYAFLRAHIRAPFGGKPAPES